MRYQNIVILTGAGISAESGIRTFRAADGLWENHRIDDVATPEAFERDPALVHTFYNQRREQLLLPDIQPNAAHVALARLEEQFTGQFLLVTQNIDNLHERAGSHNLIHMHGELLNLRCTTSGQVFPHHGPVLPDARCGCCDQHGTLRPDIVWFGEMPMQMELIYDALEACDLFISIGTSGHVYPAAGFVEIANSVGAETVEINLEPSKTQSAFDRHIYGPASREVPRFVESLISS
ncbi:NAD-dependent protein deacylase [Amphritea sp. 2_MG-2023]|uniref:Sir2 family NAD+-dependent deacetylase n=1 Tax=Amphritea TaxID=515417 RepID=UPI001C067013|nr:Sir2 family NAD+-dependent deacetylase [Amphritea sp. 2_MG-2023]MBU2965854.1 NAD-dependent protein deacylase [Amphritea atlantica]MDO6420765.1 NAD-dependent protein deacylase [Amphritea sp. 2_MG-2023]